MRLLSFLLYPYCCWLVSCCVPPFKVHGWGKLANSCRDAYWHSVHSKKLAAHSVICGMEIVLLGIICYLK
ncbi:hypothetical protein MRB53_023396 [Persea americana]|uniref:Uncharacterized protein n=1 Tax=Persea americana TaxID=3435 RepID=A0ACC2LAH9_PERAE|nr:hypothetical protein MRB53_023396 [Persea americana]